MIEIFKQEICTTIKGAPFSFVIAVLCVAAILGIPLAQFYYGGIINNLKADKERLEKEISYLKSSQSPTSNVQSDTNQTTLYLIPSPNPTTTIKDINIQTMGVPTAIGTEPGSGINVTGQSVTTQNIGIGGPGLESGIKTGDNSPVTTDHTNIQATKEAITTGNNSPVHAPNTNISR